MKELIIRRARTEDLAKIVAIVNYEILNSTAIYDYQERTYDFQLNWFEQKMRDGMPVIVAENENEVIGFGSFGIFRPWAGYLFSVEHSIYIDKNERARGVGKKLMIELIRLAKEGGYHTMIAGVDASNSKSIYFHEKFGFKAVGTFKEVGFKFDKWLDLTFLQLTLN